jgi:hypothetical protein
VSLLANFWLLYILSFGFVFLSVQFYGCNWAKLEVEGGVLCYPMDCGVTANLLDEVYKRHKVDCCAYGKVTFDGEEILPIRN